MRVINMLEAKSNLSRLVEALENGSESEILIARNGKPAARLVALGPAIDTHWRIGVAKGQFVMPETIDADNDQVATLLLGHPD